MVSSSNLGTRTQQQTIAPRGGNNQDIFTNDDEMDDDFENQLDSTKGMRAMINAAGE